MRHMRRDRATATRRRGACGSGAAAAAVRTLPRARRAPQQVAALHADEVIQRGGADAHHGRCAPIGD
jgi:hypothetical protein